MKFSKKKLSVGLIVTTLAGLSLVACNPNRQSPGQAGQSSDTSTSNSGSIMSNDTSKNTTGSNTGTSPQAMASPQYSNQAAGTVAGQTGSTGSKTSANSGNSDTSGTHGNSATNTDTSSR